MIQHLKDKLLDILLQISDLFWEIQLKQQYQQGM